MTRLDALLAAARTRFRCASSALRFGIVTLMLASDAADAQSQFLFADPPDLAVSVGADPSPVTAMGYVTYTIAVHNVATTKFGWQMDPVSGGYTWAETISSADAGRVVVDYTLPAGMQFVSASADGGFTCVPSNAKVTCANGTVRAGATAYIRLIARAPALANAQSIQVLNQVSVSMPAVERDTTNNAAQITHYVVPMDPKMADLEAIGNASQPTFRPWDPITFNLYIFNSGRTPASNVTFRFYTNLPAGLTTWRINSGFACRGLSGYAQMLEVECSGGTIDANASAFMTATVRMYPPASGLGTTPFPFTLFGYLDYPTYSIPELNENNNAFTIAARIIP